METGLGWFDKEKKDKWANGEGKGNCSKNWTGEKEFKKTGKYRFLTTQEMDNKPINP